jgi:hypothetical protein
MKNLKIIAVSVLATLISNNLMYGMTTQLVYGMTTQLMYGMITQEKATQTDLPSFTEKEIPIQTIKTTQFTEKENLPLITNQTDYTHLVTPFAHHMAQHWGKYLLGTTSLALVLLFPFSRTIATQFGPTTHSICLLEMLINKITDLTSKTTVFTATN